MAPGKRITKAAGIGGVGLALVIAAVWALTLANLRRLGVGDGADDGMILAFGQRELVSLFALLAALTLLAAFDGDMPRPAKLAALVLLPLAFAACWRSLAPLGDTPMEPWRWAISGASDRPSAHRRLRADDVDRTAAAGLAVASGGHSRMGRRGASLLRSYRAAPHA